jgi:hypothetical protein
MKKFTNIEFEHFIIICNLILFPIKSLEFLHLYKRCNQLNLSATGG